MAKDSRAAARGSRKRGTCVEVYPLERFVVETVAHIMGDQSAAAHALADADAHGGPVKFYTTGGSIIVEKLPRPDGEASNASAPSGAPEASRGASLKGK